mmetsp:Transcript_54322/g.115959  ORF Transcript_54322/g.115959 Transcript_54322/m.115959 type:complete len:202 (-) Transcript_54322:609-1214(-)
MVGAAECSEENTRTRELREGGDEAGDGGGAVAIDAGHQRGRAIFREEGQNRGQGSEVHHCCADVHRADLAAGVVEEHPLVIVSRVGTSLDRVVYVRSSLNNQSGCVARANYAQGSFGLAALTLLAQFADQVHGIACHLRTASHQGRCHQGLDLRVLDLRVFSSFLNGSCDQSGQVNALMVALLNFIDGKFGRGEHGMALVQ